MAFVDASRGPPGDCLRDRRRYLCRCARGSSEAVEEFTRSPAGMRCGAGQRGWLDALVARAEQVIRDEIQSQTDRSPSAGGRAEIASWRVFARRALAQTSEPDPSTILSQAPDHRGHAVDLGAQHGRRRHRARAGRADAEDVDHRQGRGASAPPTQPCMGRASPRREVHPSAVCRWIAQETCPPSGGDTQLPLPRWPDAAVRRAGREHGGPHQFSRGVPSRL